MRLPNAADPELLVSLRDQPILVTVCAWCGRRIVDGVAVGAPVPHDGTQSHGLCVECRDREWGKYEAARGNRGDRVRMAAPEALSAEAASETVTPQPAGRA